MSLFQEKSEHFQKILVSLQFNKVLSNHIFLDSKLVEENCGGKTVAIATSSPVVADN